MSLQTLRLSFTAAVFLVCSGCAYAQRAALTVASGYDASVAEALRTIRSHDEALITSLMVDHAELIVYGQDTIRGLPQIDPVLTGRGGYLVHGLYHADEVRASTSHVYVCSDHIVQVGTFHGRLLLDNHAPYEWTDRYVAFWRQDESGAWRVYRSLMAPIRLSRNRIAGKCRSMEEERLYEGRWALTVQPPVGFQAGGPLKAGLGEMRALSWDSQYEDCTGLLCQHLRWMTDQGQPFTVALRRRTSQRASVELVAGRTFPASVLGLYPEDERPVHLTHSAHHLGALVTWEGEALRIGVGPELVSTRWTWSDGRWTDERVHPAATTTGMALGALANAGLTLPLTGRLSLELNGQYRFVRSRLPGHRDFSERDVPIGAFFLGTGLGIRR
jgi:hypothetical protein